MISFPENFIATPWDGYFWNTKEQILYSIKIGGVLKPLKVKVPNYFNRATLPFYELSINGRPKYVSIAHLKILQEKPYTIKIKENA